MDKLVAQVAVEAIANVNGSDYEVSTIRAVLAAGELHGVSDLYLDMLRPLVAPGPCECAAQYLNSALHASGCPAAVSTGCEGCHSELTLYPAGTRFCAHCANQNRLDAGK
jgi:hypothetical protein